MEVKFNPYTPVVNIEQNKGRIFDNKKIKKLNGKIVDVKNTMLYIEVKEDIESLKTLIGETVHLTF